MIKTLRFKLIVASMFSLFLVLAIIISSVGVLNYREIVEDADSTLSILAVNGGSFPTVGDISPELSNISPELPYESRYFSVLIGKDGNVIYTNTGKIAAIDTSTAISYGENVWKSGKSRGFIGDYRYVAYTSGAETQIVFLDCGRSLSTFRSFILTSISVSVVGLLAVMLLLIFLSGRIVKPFLENYEKQKRFITDAGHELKTPLTIIDADTEILQMDLGENEWLSDIHSQVQRLTGLTNDLVLLSRMEEEQPKTQMIEFPLSDMVEETAMSFQAVAKTQKKSLTVDIQPMLSIRGDEKTLRQLVVILLDNAVKYSTPEGEISIKLEKQRNAVRLEVFNTTEAVTKAQIAHLFDRFYRTDKSRNSQTGGYGLGLSIAAAIVNGHKGKIAATTDDEKSLRITVTLPREEKRLEF